MVTFWIVPLVVMAVFFAVVEWTSKPRKAKGATEDVSVPRPRQEVRDELTRKLRGS